MKPKWEDAPEWAEYLAMDGDGAWCWYENEPEPYFYAEGGWNPNGKYQTALVNKNWQNTLEKRP